MVYILVTWLAGSNAPRTFHVQKWHGLFSAFLQYGLPKFVTYLYICCDIFDTALKR